MRACIRIDAKIIHQLPISSMHYLWSETVLISCAIFIARTDILIDVSAEELVGDIIEEVVEAHEDLKEQIPVCAGDEREGYQQDD